ncbi:uncharacterized protein PG986_004541 [Apiospora aurea]|uniref:Major facilitator superfamily (MFS) profile domain-containing protein n=1 Tax=Apiospora aurea TaxID=335848 RepID=A0ABR1QMW7_9PEZI
MNSILPDAKPPAGVLAGPPAVGVPANTGVPIEPLHLLESPKVRTKLRLYAILSGLYLALFVAALDQTIVSIAIPTITSDLHSAQGYVWIGGAYLLANAATGPIWAKCSDIWGRKPLLLAAVALFTGASLLAALSASMTMLIAGRALQGVASGGLMQLVTIVISDLFSVRKRSLYLGYVGFVWALAGSSGPLIGGAFTQFDWRWCFWINLPIGGLTFLLLVLFLDVHSPRTRIREGVKAIDWIGTISILAVTLLLLLGLDFGGAIFPWTSPKVICLIVVGGLMIGFFVFSEQRLAKYPLIPLTVFQNGSNNATFVVAFAHGMVLIGVEYYFPPSVLQASPLRSGILMLPLIGTQAVVEILAGVVIHRTGRYQELIWAGAVLMTLGTGLYITFGPETSVAMVIGLEILGAFGPALLFQGPMVSIQNTVSQDETASATACLGFIRNLAMSLSVVLGVVVFQNSMEARQSALAAAGLDTSVREALSGSQAAANVGITQTIRDGVQRHVVLKAFSWSLRNMFIMYTCLSGVALLASAFIKHRKLNEEHRETKTGIQSLAKAG